MSIANVFSVGDRVFFRPATFIGSESAMRKARGTVKSVRRIPGSADEVSVKFDRERGVNIFLSVSLKKV